MVLNEVANAQNDYQEDAQVRIAQILLRKIILRSENLFRRTANSSNVNIKTLPILNWWKFMLKKRIFQAEKFANEVLKKF